jgi:hypothetical protein
VALVLGAVGTEGYQHVRAAFGAGATDNQATAVYQGLRSQLTVAAFSGGQIEGSLHTEGDLAGLVESEGGILLSFTSAPAVGEPGGTGHTADVMLGLMPPSAPAVATPGAGYVVRCFRYTFGIATGSVRQSRISCPGRRTDGQPGSAEAQMGALLAAEPALRGNPRSATYPLTRGGALSFLTDRYVAPADSDAPGAPSLSVATRRGLLAAAFQRDGACFYLRMSAPSAAPPGQADQVWLAPADDQTAAACDGRYALAASGLYPVNGAAEG